MERWWEGKRRRRTKARTEQEKSNPPVVVRPVRDVPLQQQEQRLLEDERVVDGDDADVVDAVPARLAAARDARVHEVVRDEEEGLQPLHAPPEDARLKVRARREDGAGRLWGEGGGG